MEAVASVLTIETGIIPPTINYEDPDTEDEMDLDYVPNVARKAMWTLSFPIISLWRP